MHHAAVLTWNDGKATVLLGVVSENPVCVEDVGVLRRWCWLATFGCAAAVDVHSHAGALASSTLPLDETGE
jgi:hypothetical protein